MNGRKFWLSLFSILLFLINCKKEYSYEGQPDQLLATGTLESAISTCAPIQVHGAYQSEKTLNEAHYLEVPVHITSIGMCKIATDTQNGFLFQDSIYMQDTGYFVVKIKAIGKPIKAQATSFVVSFNSSICQFEVVVSDSLPLAIGNDKADSTWQFNEGNRSYHGYFDGALSANVNGITVLTLVGLTPTKDTGIAFVVNFPDASGVRAGVYSSRSNASFSFFDNTGNSIYTADKTTLPANLSVNINRYDIASKDIEGTFSGTVVTSTNQPVSIKDGKFKARLNQ